MNLIRLSRWEPSGDLFALNDRLSRAFGDPLGNLPAVEGVGAWLPAVDAIEEANRLVFRAELPGVNRDDIEVNVENGTLVLRGEKKQEKEVTTESAHRVERFYGTFSRSFVLPTSIDADKITATFKDGVLEIVLPKADDARPRRIKVLGA